MDKRDFPAMTGIRFIAASFVFVFHYAQVLFAGEHFSYIYFFLRQLNIGVSLFFVLSGFLITHRYFSFSFNRKEWHYYIMKRMARILPLYFLILFSQLLLLFINRHSLPDLLTILLSITLLKGLSATYFYSVLTQSWSLTVEEMFYLYAPFCFFFIKRKKVFWVQALALMSIGFFIVWVSNKALWPWLFDSIEFMFAGTFFGRCFEFFIGIFIARLIQKDQPPKSGNLITIAGGTLFIALLLLLGFYAYTNRIEVINDYLPGILLFNFLIPVSIGLFYYGLLTEESLIKKWLSTTSVVLLGKSSYAFYLLHIGMIAETIYFHVTSNVLLLFVLLQLLSISAYKLFEKPVYFFILRKFAVSK